MGVIFPKAGMFDGHEVPGSRHSLVDADDAELTDAVVSAQRSMRY
jgi:hypothetical protein